jgi:beta-1,4-mannosyl-glycoprotein beta-1,4-N-acetylglucosaminyltransferase
MVIDLFYIYNEIDLIEARLEILDKYVDRFIIVEATQSFMGIERELEYIKNIERFKKWEHKITYYVVTGFFEDKELYKTALLSPNTGNGEHFWVREFYLKESARKSLLDLKDDDIVYISDVDEIWNPKMKLDYSKDVVFKPRQLPYIYYFNQRTDEDWLGWTGTTCCKYKFIKDGLINHIRTDSMTPYEVVENGGWHFSSLGGKSKKITDSKHPFYNDQLFNAREVGMRKEEKDLPKYLLDNRQRYERFFL